MSTPSIPKDRFHIMGIYKVPPQLPRKAFEDKIAALIDELLLLPVVERNALKVEMIFQNDLLNEHVKPFDYAAAPAEDPVIIVTLQTETPDHFMAMVEDPATQKVVASAKEFGLLDACTFCADVVPKLDNHATPNGIHNVVIYKVPSNVSVEQYRQKYIALIDNWITLPAVRKNIMKFELWLDNNMFADHLRTLGFPPSQPTFVRRAESKTLDCAIEVLRDPDVKKMLLDAKDDLDFNLNSRIFTADVVTKVDKS